MKKKMIPNFNDLFSKYVRGLVSFSSKVPAELASIIFENKELTIELENDIQVAFQKI